MNKQEAIKRLSSENHVVAPGQPWELDAFRPEDAWGVARLVYAGYGDAYPVDTPYIPEKLVAACASGDIRTVVGRVPSGDIVAKGDIYRSSPRNRRLFEIGQFLILPEYRGGTLAWRFTLTLLKWAEEWDDLDGLYGEVVTNHLVTQKMGVRNNFASTAIELGLLPPAYTAMEGLGSSRETCVFNSKITRDTPHAVHFPQRWFDAAPLLYEGLDADREILPSTAHLPEGSVSEIEIERYDGAGVWRIHVLRSGADLAARMAEMLGGSPPEVVQVFLNLAEPWAGQAAEALRPLGFYLGGLTPLWFGSDGLLLQRSGFTPDFAGINLYSDKAARVLELVRADRLE